VEAIQVELEAYRDILEFYPEYQLTAEPLRIDCVIIKKAKNVIIQKNIAAIFREWNLLEYKSPNDYVSVSDFYKVYGYACLYASLEKVPINGLTISFVESRYPEKLLAHLREERGYEVEETGPGIYTIKGDILPIQIIDSRLLPAEENLWLKSLGNRLDLSALMKVSAEIKRQGKAARIQAYLNAIMQANAETIQEAIKMSNAALTLEKVLEDAGWIARWEARGKVEGTAEGEERKAISVAQKLIARGLPPEDVADITLLDPEKVKTLYKNG
jgi:hypothetical protein